VRQRVVTARDSIVNMNAESGG